MRIDCSSCGSAFIVDDSLVTVDGVRAQCPRCGTERVVYPQQQEAIANPFAAPFSFDQGGAASSFGVADPFAAPADPFSISDPFQAAVGQTNPSQTNPFAAPTANPFAEPAPTANPFAEPASTAQANPFAPPQANPFAAPPANPFAAPPANPFAAPPANPFAAPQANPFAAPQANPFAAPQANPFAPSTPPGLSASQPQPNPFAAAPANAFAQPQESNPFGVASANPFAPTSGAAAPKANPFGASVDANPFATSDSPKPVQALGETNPFAPAGNPFAPVGDAAAPSFAAVDFSGSPFGAAPQSAPSSTSGGGNPFASPSAEPGNPFGAQIGGENPSQKTPFADENPLATSDVGFGDGSNPFETGHGVVDAGGDRNPFDEPSMNDAGDEPVPDLFGDEQNKPSESGGDDAFFSRRPSEKAGAKKSAKSSEEKKTERAPPRDVDAGAKVFWQVEIAGSLRTDLSLDEVKSLIRAKKLGALDLAAKMGEELQPIKSISTLSVALPSEFGRMSATGASAVRGGVSRVAAIGGGAAVLAVVVVAIYFLRPDLFEKASTAGVNPFRRALPTWATEFPDAEGTAQEFVAEGRRLMAIGTAKSYHDADIFFRKALLIDVSNKSAVAGYVENMANLPNVASRADPEALQVALEGVEYARTNAGADSDLLRAEGALRLVIGETEQAERQLERALKADPKNPDHIVWMIRNHLERDQIQALLLVEKLASVAPEYPGLDALRGAAYARLGRFAEAKGLFQSALEKTPGALMPLRELARLEMRLGNASAATKWLDAVIAEEPADVASRLERAKAMYQLRDLTTEAEAELRVIVEKYSNDAGLLMRQVQTHLAHLLYLKNDFDGASKLLDAILEIDPQFPAAHFGKGRVLVAQGAYDGAIASLEAAVGFLKSSQSDGYYETVARAELANAMSLKGEHEQANTNFNDVIDLDRNYRRALFGLAAARLRADDFNGAATIIRRSLDIDPEFEIDRATLTDYPTSPHELDGFADLFQKAKATGADRAVRVAAEGLVRRFSGQTKEARALLTEAAKLDPGNLAALLYLALDALQQKKYPDAEEKLARLRKSTGRGHPLTWVYSGRALFLQGKFDDAETMFREVLENEPTQQKARYFLAELLIKTGRIDDAKVLHEEILLAAPNFLPVMRAMESLNRKDMKK